jgi:cyanophycin synthetase
MENLENQSTSEQEAIKSETERANGSNQVAFSSEELKPSPRDITQRNVVIKKIKFYTGPNYYLDRAAMVFNINFSPLVKEFDFQTLCQSIFKKLPKLKNSKPKDLPDLFSLALLEILRMDIDLFIHKFYISVDNEEYTIAIEYLDELVAEDATYLVADWFDALINPKVPFNFDGKFKRIQEDFDKSDFGGPTIYSLIEAGLKRNIPVNFLPIEGQFQWGYGKKSIRGRSTVLDVDGIKDTEFTTFKDSCKEFLLACGFPTPQGATVYDEETAEEEALRLGFPVVLKPVAGHKGQGVTTGIMTAEQVRYAYQAIMLHHQTTGSEFQGVIVEQMVFGKDHRLLAVGGKFAAALEREPAYVIGDGVHNIKQLVKIENDTNEDRSNNSRAPLAKIVIDDDVKNFLKLQSKDLKTVPLDGEKVYLRRVANISAGGLSKNVTDIIHPKNVKMVEDIASFFRVTAFAIDVLAEDISKPWDAGNFGIIEINAGPGIFMHLAPAVGKPIDVPGMLMQHFYPSVESARIPIIIGNNLSLNFCNQLQKKVKEINPKMKFFGSLTEEGISFNGSFFTKHPKHDWNVAIMLRHIGLDFAVMSHNRDVIHDFGIYHSGTDIVILDKPNYAERSLESEMLPHGYVVEIYNDKGIIEVLDAKKSLATYSLDSNNKEASLLKAISPYLPAIIERYENAPRNS